MRNLFLCACSTMGAEDMSYFLQAVPGAFFFVGAALPGEARPHHKSGECKAHTVCQLWGNGEVLDREKLACVRLL